MRSNYAAVATAASLAGLSVVPPTSAASAGSVDATEMTEPQLSALDPSHSDPLGTGPLFDRGSHGGRKPKGATTRATRTTSISTPGPKTTTKTKTKASEATHTPNPDEAAAIAWYDYTHRVGQTSCDAEVRLREKGIDLISKAGSADYLEWAKEAGDAMSQWGNATACSEGSLGVDVNQATSMNMTAERLVHGDQSTIA